MTSWSYRPAAAKHSRPLLFPMPLTLPRALQSTVTELRLITMGDQPPLYDPTSGPLARRNARAIPVPLRGQHVESPYPEVFEEPGSSQLLEYWQILRRRK